MRRFTLIEFLVCGALAVFLGLSAMPRVMATSGEIKANTTGQMGVFFGNATCSTGPGVSGLTNETATFGYEKQAGTWTAFGAPVTLTEINSTEAPGYYKLNYTTDQTDTLGELRVYGNATGAGAIRCAYKYSIVANLESDTIAALVTAQADLDNPDQYKADVSGCATTAQAIAIQADLDNPSQYHADVSGCATTAAVEAVKADTAAILLDTGTDGVLIAEADKDDIVDKNWDETLGDHNSGGTAGRALKKAENYIMYEGTAQSGGATTIMLDAGASATTDFYYSGLIMLVEGTGTGQVRRIESYAGSTKTITVATAWIVNPSSDSEFQIVPWASVRVSDIDATPLGDIKTALEADGSKIDHLWETTEDDGGVRRFTQNALELAPSGGGGTVAANLVQINGTDIPGTGAYVAAGFEHFYNVATPAKTMNDVGVAGSGITAQEVRDAMKLAPSGGAASTGSIDDQLADLQTDLNDTSQYKADVSGLPTTAQLEARTLPAADYFVPGSDTVTVGTNNDKTGYALTGDYDAAKSAGTSTLAASDLAALTNVSLHSDYDAAKSAGTSTLVAGDAMTLTGDYDAAKSAGTSTLVIGDFGALTNVSLHSDYDAAKSAGTSTLTADVVKTVLEADGSKIDHLWETTEDDGGVRRFTQNALELAPSGGGSTLTVDAIVTGIDSEFGTQLDRIDKNTKLH